MPEEIKFEIPDDIDESEFADYFKSNIDELMDALDQSAFSHDDRSQVDDISISSIDLSEDAVAIYYDVDISAYHGCKDLNYAKTDDREITGRREGSTFFFDKFVYPPDRTTYEEF